MCDTREFCRSSRDSTVGVNFDAIGEVEHYDQLSGDFMDVLKSGENSDVTLVVEGERFHLHKAILSARCRYFNILLFGNMMEARSDNEIVLRDTSAEGFKALVEYIYTGRICLSDQSEQVILDLLGLSNRYNFDALQQAISSYLKATLSVNNACVIFNTANFYQLKDLCTACYTYIDSHATEMTSSEGFLALSQAALVDLLSRDSFYAPEIEIFKAIVQWMEKNSVGVDEARDLLKVVRLQLVSNSDLFNIIRPSGLYQPDQILDALHCQSEKKPLELQQRGLLIPEENVATHHHGTMCIEGTMRETLLNGDHENYNMDYGYTLHMISDSCSEGITVKLGNPYIINCIRLLLWDRDQRSYSYYIEVSLDGESWKTVVDYSHYLCRSWQEVFFDPCCIRYIRVVGAYNTMNKSFHLVSLVCMYTMKMPKINKDGIIIPVENVASISSSATVLEGVSRSRNALLNGNTRDYDWDSGYTCHQLGSGSIVVQLAQPYIIGSMRLLLWDCDERTYTFYVEVSTDQKAWTRIADRTKQSCRSWQTLEFEPCPVTFIKIVGTTNTANEVFHCVHFECPASGCSSNSHDTLRYPLF